MLWEIGERIGRTPQWMIDHTDAEVIAWGEGCGVVVTSEELKAARDADKARPAGHAILSATLHADGRITRR